LITRIDLGRQKNPKVFQGGTLTSLKKDMPEAGANMEAERTKGLLRRFELPLIQFATRITGDRERARDIVQETFIQFERRGPVTQNGEPATWLFTVCRNGALNVCRKEKRLTFLDEALIEKQEAKHQPMPFDRLEHDEASGFLIRILATLPPRQQEVLQLKFQNDLSYQQIAEIIQTNANNVGVLIHTALKTLRQKYTAASKDFLPFEPRTT
jgi:RNA polymerase sigma factor (sigma-70 family)